MCTSKTICNGVWLGAARQLPSCNAPCHISGIVVACSMGTNELPAELMACIALHGDGQHDTPT